MHYLADGCSIEIKPRKREFALKYVYGVWPKTTMRRQLKYCK
jgi:hypothetical protein